MTTGERIAAPIGVANARAKLGDYVTAAARHHPVSLSNHDDLGMLVGAQDVADLLAGNEFHPEVFFEGDGVAIWLPELELYGTGTDPDEALSDLEEEIRDYAERYVNESELYLASPNRRQHYPYVMRAVALDLLGQLRSQLAGANPVPA